MTRIDEEIKILDEYSLNEEIIKAGKEARRQYRLYRQNKYDNNILMKIVRGNRFQAILGGALAISLMAFAIGTSAGFNQKANNGESLTVKTTVKDIDYNEKFDVGTAKDIAFVDDFLYTTVTGLYMQQYGEKYGIDPNIYVAMCNVDTNLNHDAYVPSKEEYYQNGVGISQVKISNGVVGKDLKNYNEVYKNCDLETLSNVETNIEVGMISFQNNINQLYPLIEERFKQEATNQQYNTDQISIATLLCSIQSKNYGVPAMKYIIQNYHIFDSHGMLLYNNLKDGINYVSKNYQKLGFNDNNPTNINAN